MILRLVKKLGKDTKGATAIEYGLIAALVGVACIGALSTVGTNLKAVFTTVGSNLKAASSSSSSTP
jgi:pilus assembly protein Flp/PilA